MACALVPLLLTVRYKLQSSLRCQARCRTGLSDSGTNMAWQSSTGHLPDREKLLLCSACYMRHISIYIHRAHLGHTMLGHPLAHMGCLQLLDKGWCGSQLAPLRSPQCWPAPRQVPGARWVSAERAGVDGQAECSTLGRLSFTLMGLGWPLRCSLLCPHTRKKPHGSDAACSP